jgi:GT2 family glycosyltransferase
VEIIPETTIKHIPFVLYHQKAQVCSSDTIKEENYKKQIQYEILNKHLERKNLKAKLIEIDKLHRLKIFYLPTKEKHKLENFLKCIEKNLSKLNVIGKESTEYILLEGKNKKLKLICGDNVYWRVKFKNPKPKSKVSIIIPTKNKVELLSKCIDSVLNKTTYKNYEILVIDNGSDDKATLAYLQEISKNLKIKVIKYDIPFNYSKINNYAVQFAEGELLLFLNNDTEVINPDWLEEMVSYFSLEDVGAVGASLYFPDTEVIQHIGVVLGIGGVARHIYRFYPRHFYGQRGRTLLPQYVSAVTGACLLVRKDVFNKVGGFDENLAVDYNDIDLCLKITSIGYKIVWSPYVELFHHESATRGMSLLSDPRYIKERNYMIKKWGKKLLTDPAYNPNLSISKDNFSLAYPPRVQKPWK